MSELIQTLRSIIREEIRRLRAPELGIVTQTFTREAEDSPNNLQVNVRLRGSGVELQRVPVAVGRVGILLSPREGDLVVVIFVGGDLNAPVVLGSVYDDQNQPPVGACEDAVYQPPDEESGGVRRIHLEMPSGSLITVEDEKMLIQSGGTEITVLRDGDITVKAAGNIVFKTETDFIIEAGGNIELKATGDVNVQGVSATLEGSGEAKVKGPSVTLAGMTSFSPS